MLQLLLNLAGFLCRTLVDTTVSLAVGFAISISMTVGREKRSFRVGRHGRKVTVAPVVPGGRPNACERGKQTAKQSLANNL